MSAETGVKQLSKEIGAEIIHGAGDLLDISIKAPMGKHWRIGAKIELRAVQAGQEGTEEEVWSKLLAKMEGGVAHCNRSCGHKEDMRIYKGNSQ